MKVIGLPKIAKSQVEKEFLEITNGEPIMSKEEHVFTLLKLLHAEIDFKSIHSKVAEYIWDRYYNRDLWE